MYGAPPSLAPQDLAQSFPVRLPTLKGISIPPLESSPPLSPIESCLIVSPRISCPSVQRIDTTGVRSQPDGSVRSLGHKHSRSLEIPTVSPSFVSVNPLDSAVSDSFLLPWSKQFTASQEVPSSLAGIYISQSSRKNPCSGIAASSIPQGISVFPSMTPVLDSPSPDLDSEEGGESEEDADSEDVWDLIPYDISWGPTYYGYREGTLPGPEGKCVFLRSPTPLKYQRTGQACEKCRERKAKCSGSRPSCARCATRGLTCIYASESKQIKLDNLINEKDMAITTIDVRSALAKPNRIDSQTQSSQNRARVRRNTDCGSHATSVSIQSRGAELRRRHSTIGSSRSSSHTAAGHRLRAYREHRVTRASMEGKDARGFPGALLDPLITFPENGAEGAEGDDHLVSESNRTSYRTLLLRTDSIGSQTAFSSSEIDLEGREEILSYELIHAQGSLEAPQDGWEIRTVDRKELPSDGSSLAVPSLAPDLVDNAPVVPDCVSSDPSKFRPSDSTFGGGYAHQTWHNQSIQACPILAGGSERMFDVPSGAFDCDSLGTSRDAMSLASCWPCDVVAQTKVELEGYSMEVDVPYIALPSHAPDFYEFDHNKNETIKAWFPSESY
ncbi:hypothetical protein ACEPAF_2552 [Sanghuangporus sanghuang]